MSCDFHCNTGFTFMSSCSSLSQPFALLGSSHRGSHTHTARPQQLPGTAEEEFMTPSFFYPSCLWRQPQIDDTAKLACFLRMERSLLKLYLAISILFSYFQRVKNTIVGSLAGQGLSLFLVVAVQIRSSLAVIISTDMAATLMLLLFFSSKNCTFLIFLIHLPFFSL